MAFMILCRARLAIGLAGASLFAASPAFADSFPSGWTDDDAPQDVQQQPAPQPQQPRQSPPPAARQDVGREPQQQPDPSWVAPDDRAAPRTTTDQADPRSASDADADADTNPSALTQFNQTLAGHGTWVDDPTYGRIWVPNSAEVGDGFAPYQTAGSWALDNQSEWLWTSDYSWGYVPFHYGRWLWVPARGWGWIPGRVYAPAWVSWRVGPGGYVGWAPMAPRYYWWRGAAVGFAHRPVSAYCFAPTGHIFARNVGAYVVRTPAGVRAAAAGTRAYQGASPNRVGAHVRMSPTPNQAHVSASAAAGAHAHTDARASAFSHGAGARTSARVTAQGSAYGHVYGHGGSSYGSSAHAYGHSFGSHASPTLRTPQHSTSSSSSSKRTHVSGSSATSSGHASGHHR